MTSVLKNKVSQVLIYSDPSRVLKNMKKYNIEGELFISNRKDKKYYLLYKGQHKIHFGSMYYYDYTRTLNEDKKMRFMKRNHKWAYADKYTPAYLSYYLLWS